MRRLLHKVCSQTAFSFLYLKSDRRPNIVFAIQYGYIKLKTQGKVEREYNKKNSKIQLVVYYRCCFLIG